MSHYWIQTYTGNRFFLDQETPSLSIHDLAAPLARIPRFVGACSQGSISVAEHSCAVADIVRDMGGNERQQLTALLHDAHKIIFGDIPRPVKAFLANVHACDISKISAGYQAQIELLLGVEQISIEDYDLVKKADMIALAVERRLFMPGPYPWPEVDALDPPKYYDGFYACWEEHEARHAFLKAYEELRSTLEFEKRMAVESA
jgi:5'-deoxynucleotidase YfbR-like HD superfamily hydrolase